MSTTKRDDEALLVWEWVVRLHRTATNEMDARLRSRFDRSLDDYDVLHQVHLHDGPISMGELAAQLLVANSSCNRVVGRLVDDGLLERRHNAADRRMIFAQLTPEGERLHRRMATVHTRDIHRLVGPSLDGLPRVGRSTT